MRIALASLVALVALSCGGKPPMPATQNCDPPLVDCNGKCLDLTKDGQNCGACGHDCLGAGCEKASCKSTSFYTSDTAGPYGLAIDATQLYFTTRTEGALYRCAKNDCAGKVTSMATGLGSPGDVQTDGKTVYFTTATAIMTCPTTGCPTSGPATFAGGQNNPTTIVVKSDRVWWTNKGTLTDPTSGSVVYCPITGCGVTPAMFLDKQPSPHGLAVDATRVIWTNAGATDGTVNTCPLGGCGAAPTVIAKDLNTPQSVVTDGKSVFFTSFYSYAVLSCPVSGCTGKPAVLASGSGWYDALALDEGYVYFGGTDGKGDALLRCAKGGCEGAPTVLATGQAHPGRIAVDDRAVYWTNTYFKGEVLRVAKP